MMIQTEEQRRWWFANHPEFSSKHRGGKSRQNREAGSDEGKINPKDVDAYVDEALKYESGPVAELLKSVKRNFGTQSVSQPQNEESAGSGWDTEAGGRAGPRSGSRRGRDLGRSLERREQQRMSPAEHAARAEIEEELQRVKANRNDYHLTTFDGIYVAQRDSIFDPYQVDREGRTNIQRIRENLAPQSRDRCSIVLHHIDQRADGPIIEMTRAEHLSIRVRQDPSEIDRPKFRTFRRNYYQARAASIRRPDPDTREFYYRMPED